MFRIGIDAHDDAVTTEVISISQILAVCEADAYRYGILHVLRVEGIGIVWGIIGIHIIVGCFDGQYHFSVAWKHIQG